MPTPLGLRKDPPAVIWVIIKSAQHFHAGFVPIADRIIYAVAPGTSSPDLSTMPLPHAGRPLWPQVADRFA